MPRKSRFRLTDILDAIARIDDYITGMDLERFSRDRKTFDAVICNIEEIGDASHHVEDRVKEKIFNVPWQDMYNSRGDAAHQYFRRDTAIVWYYISKTLPSIRVAIQAFLDKNPQDPL